MGNQSLGELLAQGFQETNVVGSNSVLVRGNEEVWYNQNLNQIICTRFIVNYERNHRHPELRYPD